MTPPAGCGDFVLRLRIPIALIRATIDVLHDHPLLQVSETLPEPIRSPTAGEAARSCRLDRQDGTFNVAISEVPSKGR